MIGSTVTTPVRGVGLALLLQQGVAAWLQAVSSCISPSPPGIAPATSVPASDDRAAPLPVPRGPRVDVIPLAQHAEIATLLAGLVLSARPVPRIPPAHHGECV